MYDGAVIEALTYKKNIFSVFSFFNHIKAVTNLKSCIIIEERTSNFKNWCAVVRLDKRGSFRHDVNVCFSYIMKGSVDECLEFFTRRFGISNHHSIWTFKWENTPFVMHSCEVSDIKIIQDKADRDKNLKKYGLMTVSTKKVYEKLSVLFVEAIMLWITQVDPQARNMYINSNPVYLDSLLEILSYLGLSSEVCCVRGKNINGFDATKHRVFIVKIDDLTDIIVGLPCLLDIIKLASNTWIVVFDSTGGARHVIESDTTQSMIEIEEICDFV